MSDAKLLILELLSEYKLETISDYQKWVHAYEFVKWALGLSDVEMAKVMEEEGLFSFATNDISKEG